jgi:hypothetical protein
MPLRRKKKVAPEPEPTSVAEGSVEEDGAEAAETDIDDPEIDLEVLAVDEEEDEDEEEDDLDDDIEEDEAEVVVAVPAVVARPVPRPSSGRPPSAKEEPEPPFAIGERVVLISNVRPRTGTPIADHPVGAQGRVETVLSQTAIVRFDRARDTKEVVAFTCLESIDDEAKALKAEREKQREREAREREKEAEREARAAERAARERERAAAAVNTPPPPPPPAKAKSKPKR